MTRATLEATAHSLPAEQERDEGEAEAQSVWGALPTYQEPLDADADVQGRQTGGLRTIWAPVDRGQPYERRPEREQ